MIQKKRKVVVILLFIMLTPMLLSGCWQRAELSDTAFVIGMGMDKADKGYNVTLQVVIPSAISSQAAGGTGGGGGVPIITTTVNVPTIYETQRKYSLINSRNAYYGHIRVLVIGERLAREGIGETLDVLKRSREPRADFYVMVAKDTTAENVLKILTSLNKLPANKLFDTLDKSHKLTAKTAAIPLNKFIEDLVNEGMNPVLTGVKIIGDVSVGGSDNNLKHSSPPTKMVYEDVAVFKKDRMLGWLNDNETIGYNYVTNNVVNSSGPVKGNDGRPIVIGTINTETSRKVKMENGIPNIYVEVNALCNVQEVMSTDNLEDEKIISELERKSEERLIDLMKNAVDSIISKYDVDVFGFGRSIYQANPKKWRELRKEGKNVYLKTTPIHYKANVNINRIGITDRSFVNDLKE